MLDRVLRMGLLYDFYGALLTQKQRSYFELHYLNDLSLSEIAEQFAVSRQAVHDILRRAEQTLDEYEQKLKLVERHQCERKILKQVHNLINTLPLNVKTLPEIQKTINKLNQLLDVSLKEV